MGSRTLWRKLREARAEVRELRVLNKTLTERLSDAEGEVRTLADENEILKARLEVIGNAANPEWTGVAFTYNPEEHTAEEMGEVRLLLNLIGTLHNRLVEMRESRKRGD